MKQPPKNMAASVRQRLLNLSRTAGQDFQVVLLRYAIERLLYRLSRSHHNRRFVLKGATLFSLWSKKPHRPTRDLDLWGRGDNSIPALIEAFKEICLTQVEDDGIVFALDTIRGTEIRIDDEYLGVRLHLLGYIARARIDVQIDIGFADDVRPRPHLARLPTLLPFPEAELMVYPKEAVVAEKFQAIVSLGITNSRMKDFYDLFVLARDFEFDGEKLPMAIRTTFERRGTPLEGEMPLGLTAEFYENSNKNVQWRAFLRKSRLEEDSVELSVVVNTLRELLLPPAFAIANSQPFTKIWARSGPWR